MQTLFCLPLIIKNKTKTKIFVSTPTNYVLNCVCKRAITKKPYVPYLVYLTNTVRQN